MFVDTVRFSVDRKKSDYLKVILVRAFLGHAYGKVFHHLIGSLIGYLLGSGCSLVKSWFWPKVSERFWGLFFISCRARI